MSDRIGYLKLFRKTLDSDFWLIDQPFTYRDAFLHVLLCANWKPGTTSKNGHTIQIQRGQWLTSIRKLADIFHWDKKKVYKWLRFMKETDMITSQNLKWGTLLTVVKYEFYQGEGDMVTHTVTHTPAHEVTHEAATRYKKKEEGRTKKEESLSAHAGTPPVEKIGPPQGSPEWYALHNND